MIEQFIEAFADLYDAKSELESCINKYDFDSERFCGDLEEKKDQAKQKAEEIMRKVIRTELKVVGDE